MALFEEALGRVLDVGVHGHVVPLGNASTEARAEDPDRAVEARIVGRGTPHDVSVHGERYGACAGGPFEPRRVEAATVVLRNARDDRERVRHEADAPGLKRKRPTKARFILHGKRHRGAEVRALALFHDQSNPR